MNIIKVEDNGGNFFKYEEYIKDGFFIPKIKKTYYIHFISPSGKEGRRRVSFFENPLTDFNPALTEYENMLKAGIDRIWDCGNDVWILNVKKEPS